MYLHVQNKETVMKNNPLRAAVLTFATAFMSVSLFQSAGAYIYNVPGSTDFSPNEEADKIESIVNDGSVIYASLTDGVVSFDVEKVAKLDLSAKASMKDYIDKLEDNGMYLTRELRNSVTVMVKEADLSEYTEVAIGYEELNKLRNVSNLRFVFGDQDTYITIGNSALSALADSVDVFRLQIKEVYGTYSVRFLDNGSHIIPKYPVDIRLGIPAEHDKQTVYLYKDDSHENWGGQFNKYSGSIEIATRYSGEYNVSSPDIVVNDIGSLTDFEQQAIRFMVARGYFDADGGRFKPDYLLTRYDFAESLVRIFFAQDDDAVCSFTDVDTDSEYYSFVASAAEKGIAEGFGDGTFRGESNVTVEQVLALASRTINNKNGYTYPEKTDEYLVNLKGDISDWAKEEIALSIREGIYSRSMQLDLGRSITRKDAAVILYRLFMIMNNIPEPVDLINDDIKPVHPRSTPWTTTNIIITASAAVILNAAVLIIGSVVRKKRKKAS